jgi:hypothetical protein
VGHTLNRKIKLRRLSHSDAICSATSVAYATLGPCLRTGCALLGRCLVEGSRGKRHIEYCGKKGTEDETCHSRFPTNVCLPSFQTFYRIGDMLKPNQYGDESLRRRAGFSFGPCGRCPRSRCLGKETHSSVSRWRADLFSTQ